MSAGGRAAADEGEPKPLGRQLFRFVISGGIAAVVDFGILWALMAVGLGHTWAKAVSFVFGTATAYLINRRWTFQAEASKRRFIAVMALYGVTFAVQVGIWAFSYPWLLDLSQSQLVAQVGGFVVAQGVATSVNFVVQRTLIFR
ncbi:MAG: GtrA family protein [Propionibacteriaceae bacterium]|nr:GtrA family protein [Propionibacteriaceae bacterium]